LKKDVRRVRIAIPIRDRRGLDSLVHEHFGRAPYFLIIDVEEGKVKNAEIVEGIHGEDRGVGKVPRVLSELGVNVVICGGIGAKAVEILRKLGIEVVEGVRGPVREALKRYLSSYSFHDT